MNPEEFFNHCIEVATSFGMVERREGRKKQNVVIRKNFALGEDNVQYFAFINPVEATSGPYSDFSLVFLPTGSEDDKFVMSIGVGSEGFRNDYELATNPGLRRKFLKMLPGGEEYYPFCKPKFTDIETAVDFSAVEKATNISLDKYRTVLPIGCLIDTTKGEDLNLANAWIAQYADIRKWASTKQQRRVINEAISCVRNRFHVSINNETIVKELLKTRRFVVLQGAPGSGKTFLAEKIGTGYDKVFLHNSMLKQPFLILYMVYFLD